MFDTVDISMHGLKFLIFNSILRYNIEVSNWVFFREKMDFQPDVLQEYASEHLVKTILTYILEFSQNHDFDGSTKFLNLPSCSAIQHWGFPCRLCWKKNNKPACSDGEVWLFETRWINLKCLYRMFRTVKISMQWPKNFIFQSHSTLKVWSFQLRVFFSEKINIQSEVTENFALKFRVKGIVKQISDFSNNRYFDGSI